MRIFFNSLISSAFFVLIFFGSALAGNTAYYIDATNGSDANTGLSHAQAWKNLSRATSLPDGSDVYLLCGETWARQRIAINWKGVDKNNYSIIGAYYMAGGFETIGVNGDGKPIIDGNNVHPSSHDGQIEAGKDRDYIWIENIEFRESAGYGIHLDYFSDYPVVRNCKFQTIWNQSIWFPQSRYAVIESNEFYDTGREYLAGEGGWPGTIECNGTSSRSSYATIRFNKIKGAYGEGISPGDYATVMYNMVIDTRSKGIYLNGNSYCEVAYNLVVGTNETTYRYVTSPLYPDYHNAGICLSVESYRNFDTTNNKIHHNVVINTFAGIQVNNSHYPDYEVSGNVIANNTLIDNYRNAYFFNNSDVIDFTNYYYNNFHYDNHADSKNAAVAGSDKLDSWVFSNNHWYPSLNDYEIAGVGDTDTTAGISRANWRGTSVVNNVSFTISDLAFDPDSNWQGIGKYLGEDFNAAWAPSSALPPSRVTKIVSDDYDIGAIKFTTNVSIPSTPQGLKVFIAN